MKLKPYLLLLFAALLFTSCTRFYGPALYHQDITYQPKPLSADSIKTSNYLSASYQTDFGSNLSDAIEMGELSYNRAHVFDHFNLAYGAFGTLGGYHNGVIQPEEPGYFTTKYFAGLGGRFSANYLIKSGNTDMRIIGIDAALSKEFGAFAGYRRYASNLPDFYTDNRTALFSSGITSEVIWHSRRHVSTQYGFKFFVGTTFGNNRYENYGNITNPFENHNGAYVMTSFFLQVKRCFMIAESESGFHFGLGYKF